MVLERSFGYAEEEVQRGTEIVVLLRQIEVLMSQGKVAPVACREAGISQQSFYRWRTLASEYGRYGYRRITALCRSAAGE